LRRASRRPAQLPVTTQPVTTQPVTTQPVTRTTLANGLTVLVRTDRAAAVVAIVTRVRAGYFDETDDVVGISHVLEHMYFKGTPTRGVGEIARETKASGGYLNAHTIYDHTSYETVLPSSGFERGLEIQADAYANSLIDAGELARELEVIIQEARRKVDSPGAVAMESLFALLHDRHRFRRWRIGLEQGLRALTRDHLLAFYRNFYRPRNTILAIVGDVDPGQAIESVTRRYGHLPDEPVQRDIGPAETGTPGFRFREMDGDIGLAQVAIGWRTPGPLHPDTPALDLAAALLSDGRGSRFYRSIRERRLAASVSAMNYTPRDAGVFVVRTEGDAARAESAATAAWAAVGDIRRDAAPAHEFLRVQRLFEARWLRRHETMEGQADTLAEWEELGGWEQAQVYVDRVLALTPAEVRDAAARHLDPDEASVLVYRPAAAPVFPATPVEVRARLDKGAAAHSLAPATAIETGTTVFPSRGATPETRVGRVAVFRSKDGVPILVRRRPGAPIVHIGVFVPGGARDEPDALAGIGTLTVRASLKGTASLDADGIANASERLGGSIGTVLAPDSGGWSLSVPTARWREAIALLQDVVQRPVFPEQAIDTERSVAIDQLAQLRDDMFRYPIRLVSEAAFGTHSYGRPLLGSESSLRAVTPDAVRDWHRRHVLSSGVVLAAVGDVDEQELASGLADAFDQLVPSARTPDAVPAWPAAVTVRSETREKAQTAFAIGFPAPRRADPARYEVELLAGIASGLGGRFFEELRDRRSLAYTVHAYSLQRVNAGMFVAYIATEPAREEEAREALLREIGRFREEPVAPAELERAARYAIGSHAIASQSSAVLLADMADAWLFGTGLAELEGYETAIAAVTPGAILDWARNAFDPGRRVEGIVRAAGQRA
jgi:zinc protease